MDLINLMPEVAIPPRSIKEAELWAAMLFETGKVNVFQSDEHLTIQNNGEIPVVIDGVEIQPSEAITVLIAGQ